MVRFYFFPKIEKTINKGSVFHTLTYFKSEIHEVCPPLLAISKI